MNVSRSATLDALANLARRARTGDILVARTSRLLDFIVARACLQFEAVDRGDRVIVDVAGVDCPLRGMLPPTPDNLRGITFETDAGRPLELQLRGRPVAGHHERASQGVGRRVAVIVFRQPVATIGRHRRRQIGDHAAG